MDLIASLIPWCSVRSSAIIFEMLTPKNFRLQDTFTPANWEYLNKTDLDLGSGNPVIFPVSTRVHPLRKDVAKKKQPPSMTAPQTSLT